MIDLKPFCSTDEFRPTLMQPWSRGAYTYATNGHILVRVARRDDVPENEEAPDVEKTVEKARLDEASFVRLPLIDLPPEEKSECQACEGRGTEHDCPDCTCDCEVCNGSGEESSDLNSSVGLFGIPFAMRNARLILSLPGVEISRPQGHLSPMPFRFEGGIGMSMPLSSPHMRHIEVEIAA